MPIGICASPTSLNLIFSRKFSLAYFSNRAYPFGKFRINCRCRNRGTTRAKRVITIEREGTRKEGPSFESIERSNYRV